MWGNVNIHTERRSVKLPIITVMHKHTHLHVYGHTHSSSLPPSTVHGDGMVVLRRREQDAVLLPASHPSGRRRSRKEKKRSTPGASKVGGQKVGIC